MGEELACQCEEGNPFDVYVVAVKTDAGIVVRSLFSVSASELYDRVSGHRQHATVIEPATGRLRSPVYFEVCG